MEAIGISSYKDDEKDTGISSYRTVRSDHFLLRGRKWSKRARPDEEPCRFLPGAIPPAVPGVISNARRGTIGFKRHLSATMRTASGAARSQALYRAFAKV